MADKNYTPETAQETPFPGEPTILNTQNQPSSSGNYAPITTKEKTMPVKRLAVELLSTALNTKSRKILQEFVLEQSGGFKIGDFKQGISGEMSLTPNGQTAKNKSGITTFAIDGDTGDAIFAGELKSGSLITGTVQVTDGNIALYNGGILEIFIGDDGT